MKKVLFITTSISYGGASKMLIFVAEYLADHGFIVSIVNLREYTNNERDLSNKVKLYSLTNNSVGYKKKIKQLMSIIHIAKADRPDLIISFKDTPNLFGVIASKLLGIPAIISERGDPSQVCRRSLRSKLYWKLINCADGGVFQTESAKDYYSDKLKTNGIVIPNPVFIDQEIRPCSKKDNSIVTFGRLYNRQKRYDIMLDAFRKFSGTHPDYFLKIYGEGEDKSLIEKWIEEKQLHGRVFLKGISENPIQDIQIDKIFIITSDYEGISNSLLEAMAGGLPVISTDSSPGGAKYVIRDSVNGLIVPTGDVDKISEAITKFVEDTNLAKTCAQNAKEVVNTFSPERIGKLWVGYVYRIISCRKK